MTETQTQHRLKKLTKALQADRLKEEHRWLVHQERAYLTNSLSEFPTMEYYKIPEQIEKLL